MPQSLVNRTPVDTEQKQNFAANFHILLSYTASTFVVVVIIIVVLVVVTFIIVITLEPSQKLPPP